MMETKRSIIQNFGVKVSHVTILNWAKKAGVRLRSRIGGRVKPKL